MRTFSHLLWLLLLGGLLLRPLTTQAQAPTITSYTPAAGTYQGQAVTITGTNFTGATSVTFNGTSATFTVTNATTITTTVPTGASTGPLMVTTPSGTATAPTTFQVAPYISAFSPTSGAAGTSVAITGTALTGATVVKFNTTNAASFTVNSSTSITAVVAAGTTTGKVTVTTPSGTRVTGANFTIIAAPTITSFTPTTGAVGTSVTLTGTTFTGATSVKFNGTSATYTVNSATSITTTVPAGATTGTISVTTAGGTATSASSFTVTGGTPAPTITSFTPASGPVGTSVTITGTDFTGATQVLFNTTSAPGFTVNSATSITATVPAGATTGTVKVTTAGGTATSATSFTVTTTSCSVSVSPAAPSLCPGASTTLTATASPSAALGYTVSSIAYAPLPAPAPAGTGPTTDDGVTTQNIGFPFTFYGVTYSSFSISANGNIQFVSASGAFTPAAIPSAAVPNGYIALAWTDWNPAVAGTITYGVTGTYPNRKLVVSYNNVAPVSGSGGLTGQIILYEGSNLIDLVYTSVVNGAGTTQVAGVENTDGSAGTALTGRNNTVWTAATETWRLSPTGVGFAWSTAGLAVGTGSVLNLTPPATTTYTVTAINYGTGCVSTQNVTVSVPLGSVAVSSNSPVDQGQSIALSVTGAPGGATYAWTGPNSFTSTAASVSLSNAQFTNSGTYSVTITSGSCSVVRTVNVSVVPTWLWARQTGFALGTSVGVSTALDPSGNTFVTGYFSDTLRLGNTTLTSAGNTDAFVAKYDPAGSLLWAIRMGGSGDDRGNGIAVDGNGDAYVTGSFSSVADFSGASASSWMLTSAGETDIFVAKYGGSSGAAVYATRVGSGSSEAGQGIALDIGAVCHVTGFFNGSVAFGATTLTANSTGPDMFVARFNASGGVNWAVKAGTSGLGNYAGGQGIAVDGSGSSYVTGAFQGTAFGSLSSGGQSDAFVAKYNISGVQQWAVKGGGSSYDGGYGIALDGSSNVYVTGYQDGSATFGATTLTSAGGDDAFVAKLNSGGGWQWAVRVGGTQNDGAYAVAADASGNVTVMGGANSTALTFGSVVLNKTYSGLFIGRLTTVGQWLWAVGNDALAGTGAAVALDGSGNAIVTGALSIPARFGDATLAPGSGGNKLFVARFGTLPATTLGLRADYVTGVLPGQQVVVPVRVRNFTNLIAVQAGLSWEPAKLTFVAVEQLNATAGLTAASFGTGQTSVGKLSFGWNDPANTGRTVADDAVLFAVRFTVRSTATANLGMPVMFAPAPAPTAVRADLNRVTVIPNNGLVQVADRIYVSGIVSAQGSGAAIPGVTVSATGTGLSTPLQYVVNGNYDFGSLIGMGTYTIAPQKSNDQTVTNGVDVLDIALIQRHVLNTQVLNSAYKAVAADVDRSSSVTMTDAALIRDLVLGNRTSFPKGRLWTFVRADETFADPNSPWPIDTARVYAPLTSAHFFDDYIGCKLGDVDANWDASIPRPVPGGAALTLAMPDATVLPGQRVVVPVTVDGFAGVSGVQGTVTWDAAVLRLVGVRTGQLTNLFTSRHDAASGHLTLLWTDSFGPLAALPDGAALVYLEFEAVGATGTSTAVGVTGDITAVRAYDTALHALTLALPGGTISVGQPPLGVTAQTGAGTFALWPNPAHDQVRLTGVAGLQIELIDMLGRVVRTSNASGAAGTLSLAGLPAGVYTVRAGGQSRRLVVE